MVGQTAELSRLGAKAGIQNPPLMSSLWHLNDAFSPAPPFPGSRLDWGEEGRALGISSRRGK